MKTQVDTSALPALGRRANLFSKPNGTPSMSKHGRRCDTICAKQAMPISSSIRCPTGDSAGCARSACRRRAGNIDAIICFGVIVKGDTLHFEMISEESMRGLGQVMHEFRRPVVVEILPVFDIQQAIDRSSDDEFNKGIEAAVAALEMISWRRGVIGAINEQWF